MTLRARLVALTTALERRAEDDVVWLDRASGDVVVHSRLDDAESRAAHAPESVAVATPDGLWEWGVRRDFVRSLPPGATKRRLGATLAGPATRKRFAHAIAGHAEAAALGRAFVSFRRRRMRAWAAAVLRKLATT